MEIKINIPANDYVQPTEVRENVVQMICSHIIGCMERSAWVEDTYDLTIRHKDWSYRLFMNLRKDGSVSGFSNEEKSTYGQIRVHTSEMQAVFTAIQDAGYHIFGWSYTTGEKKYIFTKKPVYNNRKASRMEFTEFID
jgi:hypothetical protein